MNLNRSCEKWIFPVDPLHGQIIYKRIEDTLHYPVEIEDSLNNI